MTISTKPIDQLLRLSQEFEKCGAKKDVTKAVFLRVINGGSEDGERVTVTRRRFFLFNIFTRIFIHRHKEQFRFQKTAIALRKLIGEAFFQAAKGVSEETQSKLLEMATYYQKLETHYGKVHVKKPTDPDYSIELALEKEIESLPKDEKLGAIAKKIFEESCKDHDLSDEDRAKRLFELSKLISKVADKDCSSKSIEIELKKIEDKIHHKEPFQTEISQIWKIWNGIDSLAATKFHTAEEVISAFSKVRKSVSDKLDILSKKLQLLSSPLSVSRGKNKLLVEKEQLKEKIDETLQDVEEHCNTLADMREKQALQQQMAAIRGSLATVSDTKQVFVSQEQIEKLKAAEKSLTRIEATVDIQGEVQKTVQLIEDLQQRCTLYEQRAISKSTEEFRKELRSINIVLAGYRSQIEASTKNPELALQTLKNVNQRIEECVSQLEKADQTLLAEESKLFSKLGDLGEKAIKLGFWWIYPSDEDVRQSIAGQVKEKEIKIAQHIESINERRKELESLGISDTFWGKELLQLALERLLKLSQNLRDVRKLSKFEDLENSIREALNFFTTENIRLHVENNEKKFNLLETIKNTLLNQLTEGFKNSKSSLVLGQSMGIDVPDYSEEIQQALRDLPKDPPKTIKEIDEQLKKAKEMKWRFLPRLASIEEAWTDVKEKAEARKNTCERALEFLAVKLPPTHPSVTADATGFAKYLTELEGRLEKSKNIDKDFQKEVKAATEKFLSGLNSLEGMVQELAAFGVEGEEFHQIREAFTGDRLAAKQFLREVTEKNVSDRMAQIDFYKKEEQSLALRIEKMWWVFFGEVVNDAKAWGVTADLLPEQPHEGVVSYYSFVKKETESRKRRFEKVLADVNKHMLSNWKKSLHEDTFFSDYYLGCRILEDQKARISLGENPEHPFADTEKSRKELEPLRKESAAFQKEVKDFIALYKSKKTEISTVTQKALFSEFATGVEEPFNTVMHKIMHFNEADRCDPEAHLVNELRRAMTEGTKFLATKIPSQPGSRLMGKLRFGRKITE
jgi:hypothetical protein